MKKRKRIKTPWVVIAGVLIEGLIAVALGVLFGIHPVGVGQLPFYQVEAASFIRIVGLVFLIAGVIAVVLKIYETPQVSP